MIIIIDIIIIIIVRDRGRDRDRGKVKDKDRDITTIIDIVKTMSSDFSFPRFLGDMAWAVFGLGSTAGLWLWWKTLHRVNQIPTHKCES